MLHNQHPLAIALITLAVSVNTGASEEVDLFHQLEVQAQKAGVAFGSDTFDESAEILGFKYSRPLDLYVGPDEWQEAEKQPFAHMKYARNH